MAILPKILNSLFLIPLSIIGIITSYSDIRYGKIKNRPVLIGLIYALVLYLFLFIYGWAILRQPSNLKYLLDLIINSVIATIFGYSLWYFNLWAAGDAKLFLVYASIVPLELYARNYIPYFPAASLLIDTFLLICLFFLSTIITQYLQLLVKFLRNHKNNILLKKQELSIIRIFAKINYKKLGKFILKTGEVLLTYISLLLFLECLSLKATGFLHDFLSKPLTIYILFFGLQIFAFKKLSKSKKSFFIIPTFGIIGATILLLSHFNPLTVIFRPSVLFMVLFNMAIQLVYSHIENHEVTEITPAQLYPGMVLTALTLVKIKEVSKSTNLNTSFDTINSDGLEKWQIEEIRALYQDDSTVKLSIYKTIPYAPFMFLAFVISIIGKRSMLVWILEISGLIN